jgi:hypothetical protein
VFRVQDGLGEPAVAATRFVTALSEALVIFTGRKSLSERVIFLEAEGSTQLSYHINRKG